jgi:hypothetical protein
MAREDGEIKRDEVEQMYGEETLPEFPKERVARTIGCGVKTPPGAICETKV